MPSSLCQMVRQRLAFATVCSSDAFGDSDGLSTGSRRPAGESRRPFCAASTAWSMLYSAKSSWARADSASASSGNSVDSAFASSARIVPRIRSSASPCAGDDPACAAPGGVHSCSSTGRCWSRCRSSIAVASAAVAAVPWRACQAPRYSASLPTRRRSPGTSPGQPSGHRRCLRRSRASRPRSGRRPLTHAHHPARGQHAR